jgi:hypothetical protein
MRAKGSKAAAILAEIPSDADKTRTASKALHLNVDHFQMIA